MPQVSLPDLIPFHTNCANIFLRHFLFSLLIYQKIDEIKVCVGEMRISGWHWDLVGGIQKILVSGGIPPIPH